MKTRHILIFALTVLCLTSCHKAYLTRAKVHYGDFDTLEGFDQSLFTVTSTKGTVISEDILPAETKTTYVGATLAVQKIVENFAGKKVIEIVGTYKSIDHKGNPITLSGKVVIPLGVDIQRYILVSHYTVASNAEAPSNNFPLEATLASLGYVMIFPDYEGYGVTVNNIHPYLVMDQTSHNVVDMFFAVRKMLEKTKYAPQYSDIYLMGYSQGGATTIAVEQCIESNKYPVDIRGVIAGGGPYDIRATYQQFIDTDFCGFPYCLPMVLQGMIVGNDLNVDIKDLLQPWVAEKYDEWYSSKRFNTQEINSFYKTNVTSKVLNEKSMDQTSPEIAEIYKAMTINSVASNALIPEAPVYMFHSIDDDTVPFINAVKAKEHWKDANIQVNFGHYGNHMTAAVRFILTTRTFLETAIWEEQENLK